MDPQEALLSPGFYLKQNMLDDGLMEAMNQKILDFPTYSIRTGTSIVDSSMKRGGKSFYRVIGGDDVANHFRPIQDFYIDLCAILSTELDRDVITSPYTLSGVNIRVYPEGKGIGGWHYDTQPLTALLYMTGGSPTEVIGRDGNTYYVQPTPGTVLVMEGRECLHRILLQESGDRISVPLNYYYPGDTERPSYVDDHIFGDGDA